MIDDNYMLFHLIKDYNLKLFLDLKLKNFYLFDLILFHLITYISYFIKIFYYFIHYF